MYNHYIFYHCPFVLKNYMSLKIFLRQFFIFNQDLLNYFVHFQLLKLQFYVSDGDDDGEFYLKINLNFK